jgi:tyrosyl-DNA phosphodiesterase 2
MCRPAVSLLRSCLRKGLSIPAFSRTSLQLNSQYSSISTSKSNMSRNPSSASFLNDSRYAPRYQQHWYADQGEWNATATAQAPRSPEAPINAKTIRLISWNIDFLIGYAEERMSAALHYLEQLTASTSPELPVVIFMQEMVSSDLKQIRESEWIKKRFNITDLNPEHWRGSRYGTTTLVDRRLKIESVFRVPFYTGMDRDGLFVDLALSRNDPRIFRLCNVHLESLVADPPVRPIQLAAAAKYLNDKNEVAFALLAGDLNAIQPFDRTLHVENSLGDAYLELGGQEDSEEGYTWGQQAKRWARERFGCSRMDKILFSGEVHPQKFGRIGMGVKVADDVLEEVEQEVEGGFVTDHYGVMGDFELTGDWKLDIWDGGVGREGDSRL